MPSNNEIYLPDKRVVSSAHVKSLQEYRKLYSKSIQDPEGFWSAIAADFYWKVPPSSAFFRYNFDVFKGRVCISWMEGAKTNICYNALDRNVERGLGDRIAFHWEGNDPGDDYNITYRKLLCQVCKFANVLKKKGVKKGDCVVIYMPMIIELVIAMLACARIGAIHSVVFGGFSADSLAERIQETKCKVLVTCDAVWRGTKLLNLKTIADTGVSLCVEKGQNRPSVIVVRHLGFDGDTTCNGFHERIVQPAKRPAYDLKTPWNKECDSWWHNEMSLVNDTCEPEWVDAEDPLFVLFTSGSTGKPKGVQHTTGGYMIYTATTFKHVFDYHPEDTYFCTADIGWITGHSYVVYGPLLMGASSVMFEGIPTHPDPGRYWDIIQKYKVNQFYTAPTAIRSLMKFGDSYVKKYDLDSLRILGTVGEPINPQAWQWYYRVVGKERCSIVDTFWQSETGGHVLTPLPGCTPMKPGSATLPFFGVVPVLLDENGKEVKGEGEGYLVFKMPWPGMMRTLFGNHERFETTYFKKFPGYYCTGDGAKRDSDGYYWITGRMDDMLNVSGHLLSTAEVESALIEHTAVSESAAIACPHALKGECLYCYVVLKEGFSHTEKLEAELKYKVRAKIGAFAVPEYIHIATGLPKTRSGKIMRRILRKIAVNDKELGDLSTLAEEHVIDDLFQTRPIAT